MLKKLFLAAGLLATNFSEASAITFFTSEDAYRVAVPGAIDQILPNNGFLGSGVTPTAGPFSFGVMPPSGLLLGTSTQDQFSTLIPGNDVAISGKEDFFIASNEDLTGFSFLTHEPTANGSQTNFTDTCNAECVQSSFRVTIFSGGEQLAFFDFQPLDDQVTFLGVASDAPFDGIAILEFIGTADNEFFGDFTFATATSIPIPAPFAMLASALVALLSLRSLGASKFRQRLCIQTPRRARVDGSP